MFFFRSPTESLKLHEEKQAKAQELREKLTKERSERVHLLTAKVHNIDLTLKEDIFIN